MADQKKLPLYHLELIEGPHLLFTGQNGRKTFGITVRNYGTVDEIEKRGLSRTFHVNDFSIKLKFSSGIYAYQGQLSMNDEEFQKLLQDMDRMVAEGNPQ